MCRECGSLVPGPYQGEGEGLVHTVRACVVITIVTHHTLTIVSVEPEK